MVNDLILKVLGPQAQISQVVEKVLVDYNELATAKRKERSDSQ